MVIKSRSVLYDSTEFLWQSPRRWFVRIPRSQSREVAFDRRVATMRALYPFATLISCKSTVTNLSPIETRLMEVEMQLMHLQHEYDQLNAEFLRQRTLFENQSKRLERLENLLRDVLQRLDSSASDTIN